MQKFLTTKIKSENPVWIILMKWAVGIILMFGLSYIFLNNEKQNIESN